MYLCLGIRFAPILRPDLEKHGKEANRMAAAEDRGTAKGCVRLSRRGDVPAEWTDEYGSSPTESQRAESEALEGTFLTDKPCC